MQDVVYAAADGLQVILYAHTWDHIQQRHHEVTLADIEQALISPVRIVTTDSIPNSRCMMGHRGPRGTEAGFSPSSLPSG
jgi:hypothetical protein